MSTNIWGIQKWDVETKWLGIPTRTAHFLQLSWQMARLLALPNFSGCHFMFGFMNHFLMGCPQGIQTCLAFETSF
jgi:hypothetical protein